MRSCVIVTNRSAAKKPNLTSSENRIKLSAPENSAYLHFARAQFLRASAQCPGRTSDDRSAERRMPRGTRSARRSVFRLQGRLQRADHLFLIRDLSRAVQKIRRRGQTAE